MPKNERAARGGLVTLAARASILVATTMLLAAPAAAQTKKVPGEKWRNTISVQGMGMTMPQRTFEVCVPKGKENESMARPERQDNCSVYDTRQSGNTYTAKIRCTGETPMEGTFESTKDGNTVRGSSVIRSEGVEMRTQFSATPLGTACEAIEYTGTVPPAASQPGRGTGAAGPDAAAAAAAAAAATARPPEAGTETAPDDDPEPAPAAEEPRQDAIKEGLDRGRRVLRGLLGN